MMAGDDIKAAGEALRAVLAQMRAGVAFTGAGISTECGIPDFRSPGGLWTRNRPIDYQDFRASAAMRAEAWRRSNSSGERLAKVRVKARQWART